MQLNQNGNSLSYHLTCNFIARTVIITVRPLMATSRHFYKMLRAFLPTGVASASSQFTENFMEKTLIMIAITVAAAGCSNKNDVNEKNFGLALSQHLEKKGQQCLGLTGRWPIDIPANAKIGFGYSEQMAALEAVGLVQKSDVQIDGNGYNGGFRGQKVQIKRYHLTEASKPYQKSWASNYITNNETIKQTSTDLCWSQKSLDKVVKWDGPVKFGDYQAVNVFFIYKLDNVAKWAKKPEIQSAFPGLSKIIENAGSKEEMHGLHLTTSGGWETQNSKN